MNTEQSNKASKELSYIKTIMNKSQFSFTYGTKFFITISVYLLLINVMRLLPLSQALTFLDYYYSKLTVSLLTMILIIPLFFIIGKFNKIAKQNSEDLSLWLYQICAFTILVCTVISSIALLPNITDNIMLDVFSIASASICIFICGQFLQSKKMKIFAIIYFIGINIILFVLGLLFVKIQTRNSGFSNMDHSIILLYSYGTAIINLCYAPLGYLLLGLGINKIKKQARALLSDI